MINFFLFLIPLKHKNVIQQVYVLNLNLALLQKDDYSVKNEAFEVNKVCL